MAGTIDIRDDAVWMPAGWIFDDALELIAGELEGSDPALATQLLNARSNEGSGYLDLRMINPIKFRAILSAVESVYNRTLNEGPNSFSQPAFYDGFMKHLNNLKLSLQSDVRAQRPPA